MESSRARRTEELFETLTDLGNHMKVHFERVLEPYDLPAPCAKALCLIEGATSLKELGMRIHCDGSFVTSIADGLEERGLARREIDREDRRIKNLVLTPAGSEVRSRLLHGLFDDFPGLRNLTEAERESFIVLLRKMLDPGSELGGATPPHSAL
jgi:DNA-binding MarR family transcriptional regulator